MVTHNSPLSSINKFPGFSIGFIVSPVKDFYKYYPCYKTADVGSISYAIIRATPGYESAAHKSAAHKSAPDQSATDVRSSRSLAHS